MVSAEKVEGLVHSEIERAYRDLTRRLGNGVFGESIFLQLIDECLFAVVELGDQLGAVDRHRGRSGYNGSDWRFGRVNG